MLGPMAWAAAAFFITYYFVGWKGWFVVGPILILLLIDPAWAAALFLLVVGVVAGGLLLWAIWKILPWAIFFLIGVWMAYGLLMGMAKLAGV